MYMGHDHVYHVAKLRCGCGMLRGVACGFSCGMDLIGTPPQTKLKPNPVFLGHSDLHNTLDLILTLTY